MPMFQIKHNKSPSRVFPGRVILSTIWKIMKEDNMLAAY
jgi:hypothetical protein